MDLGFQLMLNLINNFRSLLALEQNERVSRILVIVRWYWKVTIRAVLMPEVKLHPSIINT